MPRGNPRLGAIPRILWPEERTQRLRRMFAAGCSDDEICLALGLSRGAVIGKRQREGLFRAGHVDLVHNEYGRGDAYTMAIRRAERERQKESEA